MPPSEVEVQNEIAAIARSQLFDPEWYIRHYPEVKLIGLDPLEHFVRYGRRLGYQPNPWFDSQAYLASHPMLDAGQGSSFAHYIHAEPKDPERQRLRIAVVFHAFHLDLIEECIGYIENIGPCDVFVTTPHSPETAGIRVLRDRLPRAMIVQRPNRGRDVAPFLSVWRLIESYDLCCKIHTKKGETDFGEAWRNLCFDTMFSASAIQPMIDAFYGDPLLAIAGPECMYKSGIDMMGANADAMRSIELTLGTNPVPIDSLSWGFFAGSIFWFRPSLLHHLGALTHLEFETESGADDGKVEHAVERLFGSRILSPDCNIALVRRNLHGRTHINVSRTPAVPDRESFITTLEKYQSGLISPEAIVGDLNIDPTNLQSISGWLAVKGDLHTRRAVVEVDDQLSVYVTCSIFRADLVAAGVNDGFHGFSINVPEPLKDGLPHRISLIDAVTGKTILIREGVRWRG